MSDQMAPTTGIPNPPLQVPQEATPAPPPVMPIEVEQIDPKTRDAINGFIQKACKQGTATDVPTEIREAASAVLALSQALVILDPTLVAPQGVPPNALHPPLPHIQVQHETPPPPAAAGSSA